MDEAQGLVLGLGQSPAPPEAALWWGVLSVGPGSYRPAPTGWEDVHKLQTAVLQSAISDMLDRPMSMGSHQVSLAQQGPEAWGAVGQLLGSSFS